MCLDDATDHGTARPSLVSHGVPATAPGTDEFTRTPRPVQIIDHDTTKQTYVQADYNAAFTAAGFHTLKVGGGVRRNANDVDQRYPGGRVDVFWDSTFTEQRARRRRRVAALSATTKSTTSGPFGEAAATSRTSTCRTSGAWANSR